MIGQSLVDAFGKDLSKSFGSLPGSTGKGAGVFAEVAKAFATSANTPAPLPVEPGRDPNDLLKSLPNASTND